MSKPFNFHRVTDTLRFSYGLNYYQTGRWLIRRGHVKDMEEYERRLQEPEEQ
jgi:hypothetical protein